MERKINKEDLINTIIASVQKIRAKLDRSAFIMNQIIKATIDVSKWLSDNDILVADEGDTRDVIPEFLVQEVKTQVLTQLKESDELEIPYGKMIQGENGKGI